MTTRGTPTPLELMAEADVRQAVERGEGVAVLDAGLGDVLFANAAARALLGLSAPVAGEPVPLAAGSPAVRQIRSAGHVVETRGTAGVILRAPTRTGSRTLQATLARRLAVEGDTVLLTIAAPGRTDSDAASLLADAGLGAKAGAIFLDGLMRTATPAFDAERAGRLDARMAAFGASAESLAVEDDGSVKVTLARAPFGHVLVLTEPSERPAATGPAETGAEAESAPADAASPSAPMSPGFSSFSVKRPKLGEARGGMSMRALLQRWYLRGPSAMPAATETSGEEAGAQAETSAPEPGPKPGPAPSVEDAGTAPSESSVRLESPEASAPERPSLFEDVPASRPGPRRSAWGTPLRAAGAAPSIEPDALSAPSGMDEAAPRSLAGVEAPDEGGAQADEVRNEDAAGFGEMPAAGPHAEAAPELVSGEAEDSVAGAAAVIEPDLGALSAPLSADDEEPTSPGMAEVPQDDGADSVVAQTAEPHEAPNEDAAEADTMPAAGPDAEAVEAASAADEAPKAADGADGIRNDETAFDDRGRERAEADAGALVQVEALPEALPAQVSLEAPDEVRGADGSQAHAALDADAIETGLSGDPSGAPAAPDADADLDEAGGAPSMAEAERPAEVAGPLADPAPTAPWLVRSIEGEDISAMAAIESGSPRSRSEARAASNDVVVPPEPVFLSAFVADDESDPAAPEPDVSTPAEEIEAPGAAEARLAETGDEFDAEDVPTEAPASDETPAREAPAEDGRAVEDGEAAAAPIAATTDASEGLPDGFLVTRPAERDPSDLAAGDEEPPHETVETALDEAVPAESHDAGPDVLHAAADESAEDPAAEVPEAIVVEHQGDVAAPASADPAAPSDEGPAAIPAASVDEGTAGAEPVSGDRPDAAEDETPLGGEAPLAVEHPLQPDDVSIAEPTDHVEEASVEPIPDTAAEGIACDAAPASSQDAAESLRELTEAETAPETVSAIDAGAPAFGYGIDTPSAEGPDDPADEPLDTDAEPAAGGSPGAIDPPSAIDAGLATGAGASPIGSAFEPRFDVAPIRFVWQIDREGAFRFLSPDFASAVGPQAADVLGRTFSDVARVFGFDGTGEIARLLERRDTWSGRSIHWPVEGSSRKVPVDLAALPVYGRDRSFDGFRGFGVVRMNESVADDEGLGLLLAGGAPAPAETKDAAEAGDAGPEAVAAPDAAVSKPLLRTFEADRSNGVFGRRAEPPAAPGSGEESGAPKVIRLEERRRPRDGTLSQAEEAAFRAIGAKLGSSSEAESPGALRFADMAAAPAGGSEPEVPAAEAGTSAEPDDARVPATRGEQPAGIVDASDGVADDLALAEAAQPEPGGEAPPVAEALPASETVSAGEPVPDAEFEEADASAVEGREDEAAVPTDAGPDASARPGAHDDEDPSPEPVDLAVFERLFASLPLALLVQARERLVYANAEFSVLTGHADVASVEAAGGLDALIADRGEGGSVLLRGADGATQAVRAHMQRVAENGRSALLISFSPVAAKAAPAPAPAPDAGRSSVLDDLRQQVEELQAVLDTATDGVVLLDTAGAIRAMNGSAHALFGLGPNEATGRDISSLFAHESQKSMLDYLEMLRDDGIGGILNDGRELIGRVAQGGFIPLFVTVGRLFGDRGWCVVIRDIAHWKRIEEDLVNARRQAEAASLHKSRFLANISHELRTPLNAIIGFADVMASECFGPIGNERYLDYLGDIKRSGHHVLDLVNDLLDISKIEAGKLDLSFEAVSLNEIVSEVVSLMQPQANRERVIVRSNLPSSVPPVVADRRTMRQIALNLVANAIRFTPAGGQIIASTTYTAEGEVLLRFRDSGIGMTEREIEIALTPFQQVHAPSATRGEGTGLGLPLTKAMVEANRAQFAIHSTPGEGTLVEIAFPAPRVLAD